MTFQAICPACRSAYQLSDTYKGKKVRCPRCQETFVAAPAPPQVSREPLPLPSPPSRTKVRTDPSRQVDPAPRSTAPKAPVEAARPRGNALPWIIAGSLAASLLLIVCGGVGVFLYFTLRDKAPVGQVNVGNQATPDRAVLRVEPDPSDRVGKKTRQDRGVAKSEREGEAPRGQLSAQALEYLKGATVYIKVEAGRLSGSGSGFLVRVDGNIGYVITNHHVVNPEAEMLRPASRRGMPGIGVIKVKAQNQMVTAVFHSGSKKEHVTRAEILATDNSRDLAVLRTRDLNPWPKPIDLDQKVNLVETMPVYILGFPFGEALSTTKGYPAPTTNKGSISSLRQNDYGQLKAVQIDGAINPGNSGGPVVDEAGHLIGISVATIRGSGIGLAIAPDELQAMFQGRVGGLALHQTPKDDNGADYDVEMQLIDAMNKIKSAGLLYSVSEFPQPQIPAKSDGTFEPLANAQRLDLQINEQKATGKLSVKSAEGKRYLCYQTVYVNGSGKTFYTQASSQLLHPPIITPPGAPGPLASRPLGELESKPIARTSARGGPLVRPPSKVLPIEPAALKEEKKTISLPGEIRNVCAGGGGRFLIFHLPEQHQLGVFDMNAAAVVKYLPMEDSNILIAAGMDKLMVVLPDKNLIQRWDLTTFERAVTAPFEIKGRVHTASMGSATDGPLILGLDLARWPPSGAEGQLPLSFLDIRSLHEIELNDLPGRFGVVGPPNSVRASANGRTVTMWPEQPVPFGLQSVLLDGNTLSVHCEHRMVGKVIPGPDGRTLFTSTGLYTSELKPLGQQTPVGDFRNPQIQMLPALQGELWLSLSMPAPIGPGGTRGPASYKVQLHMGRENRPLLNFSDMDGVDDDPLKRMEEFRPGRSARLGIDQRVFLVPAAKMLVTIPLSADKLYLRRFDLDDILEKSGIDFLYVVGQPVANVAAGKLYSYDVAAKSKKGGVGFKVEIGPPGMEISKQGKLTWNVPKDFRDRSVDVVLAITDASGQEILHNFTISVQN